MPTEVINEFEDNYAKGIDDRRAGSAVASLEASLLQEDREIEQKQPEPPAPPSPDGRPAPQSFLDNVMRGVELSAEGQMAQAEAQQAAGEVVRDVAGDVAKGLVREGPNIVVGSVLDATKAVLETGAEMEKWERNLSPNARQAMNAFTTNPLTITNLVTAQEGIFEWLAEQTPVFPAPTTVTANLLRTFGMYLVPTMGLLGTAKGATAAVGLTGRFGESASFALSGIGADMMISMDSNLANMIQDTPLLEPVTEFLGIDPLLDTLAIQEQDSELTKRIKGAMEGLGIGIFADLFITGIRLTRSANHARAKKRQAEAEARGDSIPSAPDDALEQMRIKVGEISDEQLAAAYNVPDIDAPLVSAREGGRALEAQIRAAKQIPGDVRPEDLGLRQGQEGPIARGERTPDDPYGPIEATVPERGERSISAVDDVHGGGEVKFAVQNVGTGVSKTGKNVGQVIEAQAGETTHLHVAARAAGIDLSGRTLGDLTNAEIDSISGFRTGYTIGGEFTEKNPVSKSSFMKDKSERQKVIRAAEKGASIDPLRPEPTPEKVPTQIAINWRRIESEGDANDLLRTIVDGNEEALNQARRVGRTLEEVRREADGAPPLTLRQIFGRSEGNPLNDIQTTQLRDLAVQSVEDLKILERKAIGGTPADVFAFRHQYTLTYGMLEQMLGARADASRSFGSWRITAKGNVERAGQMKAILDSWGGEEVSRELARRMAKIEGIGPRLAAMEKGWGAKSLDALREVSTVGLLWWVPTHLANMGATAATNFVINPVERAVAARGRAFVGGEGVEMGEAIALFSGMQGSLLDAFTASGRRAVTRKSSFADIAGEKLDVQKPAFSAEVFNISSETGLGRTADILGRVHTFGADMLGVEDEWFKTIGYGGEVSALATREAMRRARIEGLDAAATKQIYGEIKANPPESIRVGSVDAAQYNTFTKFLDGAIAKVVRQVNKWPVGFWLATFVNTPLNLLAYSFERSPLAVFNTRWRADVAAGGARRDIAITRMALGSATGLLLLDMAEGGHLTGSGPERGSAERKALERTGWKPQSVYLTGPEQFVPTQRFDQLSLQFAMAGEISDLIRKSEIGEDDMDDVNELMSAFALALASSATDRTWVVSMSDALSAVTGQRSMEWYLLQRAKQSVPFSSLIRGVESIVDPVASDTNNLFEAVQSMIPVLASKLTSQRDLWGFEIQPDPSNAPWFNSLTPVKLSTLRGHEVDQELVAMEAGVPEIQKKMRFQPPMGGAVQIDFRKFPKAYEEYKILAGHKTKDPVFKLSAVETANNAVTGKGTVGFLYKRAADDEDRVNFIRSIVQSFREQARTELWNDPDHADFREYVEGLQEDEGVLSPFSR